MSRSLNKAMRWILIVLFAIIFVGGVAQAVYVDVFNKTVRQASGADETQEAYFTFGNRGDSTSTWIKRDFNLNGKTVDLQAQTIDGTAGKQFRRHARVLGDDHQHRTSTTTNTNWRSRSGVPRR